MDQHRARGVQIREKKCRSLEGAVQLVSELRVACKSAWLIVQRGGVVDTRQWDDVSRRWFVSITATPGRASDSSRSVASPRLDRSVGRWRCSNLCVCCYIRSIHRPTDRSTPPPPPSSLLPLLPAVDRHRSHSSVRPPARPLVISLICDWARSFLLIRSTRRNGMLAEIQSAVTWTSLNLQQSAV